MLNVAGTIAFAGFLAAAAWAAHSRSRRAVSGFVAFTMAISLAAALFQRDLWPFARWPMAGGLAEPWASTVRVRAVDEAGEEHDIDARAFEPIEADELVPWLHRSFERLSAAQRAEVAAHLLGLAEAARESARGGEDPGRFARRLGPLTAPGFNLHPRAWSDPRRVPERAFARLRVYREIWNHEERRRDPARVRRRLLYEYPAP